MEHFFITDMLLLFQISKNKTSLKKKGISVNGFFLLIFISIVLIVYKPMYRICTQQIILFIIHL